MMGNLVNTFFNYPFFSSNIIGQFIQELVSKLKLQLASGKKQIPQHNERTGDRDVVLIKNDFRTGLAIPLKTKRAEDPLETKKKKV